MSCQDEDISLLLQPYVERHMSQASESNADWRLIIRLRDTGSLLEAVTQPHVPSIRACLAEIVTKLEVFMAVGDAVTQIHPYVYVTWRMVTCFYQIVAGQVDRDARLGDLSGLMRDSYFFVEDIKSFPEKIPALEQIIRDLLSQTVECIMFIRECSGHGFGEVLISGAWMDRQITQFMQSFTALRQSLETGVSIQTSLVCFRIDAAVNRLLSGQSLMKLGPADMDGSSRPECLPETRMDFITKIFEWASMPTLKNNVFWLHGFPGSGKSAITTSVANMFRNLRRLGSFVFFTRGVAARNDPAVLIRTLAYQLGEFDHRIGSAISKVIEDVPSIRQAPLRWQFQKLLVEPLSSLEHCLREGPIVVVIDALDECGCSGAREELLKVIATESPRLPSTIRIFITSRAEKDIYSVFTAHPNILAHEIDLKSTANEQDVQTYIHHRMTDIRLQNEFLGLPPDWPGQARINGLALRASGLFVWASTACRYIENGQDPEERLSQLVHTALYADAEAALDGIYTTALESAGKWEDDAFGADFREILGIVIVSESPLTAKTIDLLNADIEGKKKKRPCLHTIRHLGTVLQWAEDKPICVMHPSFADFITERRRCGRDAWFIDRPAHHLRVARLCIARLGLVLKKNMCGLKLSTSMSVVMQELPEDVTYPARYWVDHLCNSEAGSERSVAQEIYNFLHKHFLHWIEVMTVMKKARQTIGSMIRLKEWLDTNYTEEEGLRSFAKDAVRFCQAYAHVYEQHPLLVYQSALPFTPTASVVFQTFKDDPYLPYVSGGFRQHWAPLLIEFGWPGGNVVSLSPSADGQHIASTNTRSISVWDSTSGELVTKPMGGGNITVIAFSPDNQRIASGSSDGSVRLWDALSGKEVLNIMQGHQGAVYGLVFSNDGSMLVSASKDKSIVVWDTNTFSIVHGPLTGHQKSILALAFSPVGTRFVSGSRDRSIRIWDAMTGEEAIPRIKHQGGGVTSLVYTPDGSRIISGSDDRTIRIWDADKGTLVYRPTADLESAPFTLTGHNSDIYSLAVSPCGTLLASASKDTTVRLWDLSTGTELSHLVRQHRLAVRCVVFSRDGKRIVTGSQDATVRVWDVESVGSMGAQKRHKSLVSHLAFSADGKRIVSGGLDKTVRMWCAKSGRELIDPLWLERDVYAVAFDDEGGRILAADRDGAVFAWDMESREPLMATPADHPNHYAREGPLVLEGKWIVDGTTNDALTLLPNMSPAKARASWKNRIAIGLANGGVVILHFPELSVS
ncbi:quinon protein alcohol dehydrogenase-like superfamily [Melanogaster broomeanus]|nr:quinon protein alcohol dehydrogenase-like superfamily [Melanogaster broomeanus]